MMIGFNPPLILFILFCGTTIVDHLLCLDLVLEIQLHWGYGRDVFEEEEY